MSDVRIMIANRDAFTRQILAAIFGQRPEFRVVGTFEDSGPVKGAMSRQPDILFVDLPDSSQEAFFQDVRSWRREFAACSVIVCTQPDSPDLSTLHFIQNGLSDRLRCPSSSVGLQEGRDRIEETVLSKIRRLVETRRTDDFDRLPTKNFRGTTSSRRVTQPVSTQQHTTKRPHTESYASVERKRFDAGQSQEVALQTNPYSKRTSRLKNFELVTLGISTGGPQALMSLLQAFREPLPVPVLIVQHMPPDFTRILAQRLTSNTVFEVAEAADGDVLKPGQVLIAPGNFHMTLQREQGALTVRLSQGERVNGCRPSVDVLWNSVSEFMGPSCLAVIMTGMGKDGLDSARALKSRGATILAQDEASSVIWGMPGAIVRAGLADEVIPLEQLAGSISSRLRRSPSPFLAMEDAP